MRILEATDQQDGAKMNFGARNEKLEEEGGVDHNKQRNSIPRLPKGKALEETDISQPVRCTHKFGRQKRGRDPPPPAAGAIVCPVPSLVGTGRSSIPRPKVPGCCLQVQRQWGPAFEQVQRQWGPDLWSQPLLKSAVPVAPLTLPLPPVGHFKGFPRSFLESAQSQHLQPSH